MTVHRRTSWPADMQREPRLSQAEDDDEPRIANLLRFGPLRLLGAAAHHARKTSLHAALKPWLWCGSGWREGEGGGGGGGGADRVHYACVCPYAQASCN